jgi:hypothetical protein
MMQEKYDCEKIKVLAGYYLHGNKQLPFDEYCKKAHCMYLHHFNDHCCCDTQWCKVLQHRAIMVKQFYVEILLGSTSPALSSLIRPCKPRPVVPAVIRVPGRTDGQTHICGTR